MSLQTQYRPKSFKTFVGNKDVVSSLQTLLKRENPPSAFLFTGPGGTGKTTLARIVKSTLKCKDVDWKELNAADDRGIDGIRKLINDMKFTPYGDRKVFLLDECFSADTSVLTNNGNIRIDNINIGDIVNNLNGTDEVEKIFINKVALNRVVKVNKSDGTHTFCSEDHEYYNNKKWIKAKDLTKIRLVKYSEQDKLQGIQRVCGVEIYKRGDNDESFSSIIGDKERNQGFVKFYDLQIKTNHSYIANGNMVHNCHMLTKTAQEALLKSLEEPPSYMHWILCTTNPEVLKPTLKRRCHSYELESLKDADLHKLMRMILKKEKRESITPAVRDKIIELSDGSAGIALKLLDQVIDMDDVERALNTLKSVGTGESEIIDICRTLISYNMPPKTKWAKVKKLLKEFKGDGESARRPILGYFNSVLLNNGGDDTFFIMQPFKENFFDSGKAGLTMACYESIFGAGEE